MPTTAPAPARLVAAACVLGAVGLLGAAVVGSAVGEDTASLTTRLLEVSDGAVVVAEDGTRRPARPGAVVQPGEQVRAAFAGTSLTTGERVVELGAGTAVTVEDGARQQLDLGEVLVVAMEDELAVAADAATVEVQEDGVVRVTQEGEGGLLAAALVEDPDVDAAVVRAPGRSAATALPGLHQLRVLAGVLPGTPRALRLHDERDPWEDEQLTEVVRADRVLRDLQGRFAERDELLVRAAVATDGTPQEQVERAVRRALAHTGGTYDPRLEERVSRYREQDGSWGVAARLSGTRAEDARSYYEGLLPDAPVLALPFGTPGSGGSGAAQLPARAVPGAPSGPGAAPGSGPSASEDDAQAPAPRPPGPRPTPTPSPTGLVQAVVDAVLDLLPVEPTPPPAPAPAPAPVRVEAPITPAPAVRVAPATPTVGPSSAPAPVLPVLTGGKDQPPPGQLVKELADLGLDVKVKDLKRPSGLTPG